MAKTLYTRTVFEMQLVVSTSLNLLSQWAEKKSRTRLGKLKLVEDENGRRGWALNIALVCDHCGHATWTNTSPNIPGSSGKDINRRAVLFSLHCESVYFLREL